MPGMTELESSRGARTQELGTELLRCRRILRRLMRSWRRRMPGRPMMRSRRGAGDSGASREPQMPDEDFGTGDGRLASCSLWHTEEQECGERCRSRRSALQCRSWGHIQCRDQPVGHQGCDFVAPAGPRLPRATSSRLRKDSVRSVREESEGTRVHLKRHSNMDNR